MQAMNSIFEYTDFRKWINDYYEATKAANPRFSYRNLASRAGINAGNLTKILKGERNLSAAAAGRMARVLKLTKRERDYFQAMVSFCQAKKHSEKKQFFEELMSFKESSVRVLDANQYLFYDKWYYTAVREALSFFPLSENNFGELGKWILPAITENQVKKAVKLLCDLDLVQKNSKGMYERTEALISSGNNIRSLVINNFVINTMKLAEKAINQAVENTNLSSVTISISSDIFDEIQEEVRKCRRKIMELAKNCKDPDVVYQLNTQLFPMTKPYKESE